MGGGDQALSSIDERVVELQFNNGQFEKGVSQSIGTLEKLKGSLNLEASAKSLNSLERAGKNFNLSNVSNNIQTVADRFSTLGIIGDQVLRRLTNSAMNMSRNILTAIPNQMMAGGKKRALNIEQAKFQMEGLLGPDEFAKQWETINKNINNAVTGTAYGYDEAAKVAAQLKASNIDFGEDMEKILTGISGVAAMTNSSYEDIGHIFTTIAGQGKVMTEQLNQFAGRGLNVAAELAKAYKVDEATLRTMVTKGEVDFKTFAFAMNEAFGKQAQKANKTFTGAMSNIKASFSRMGAQFIQPGYEALRKFFVGFNENETTGLLRVLKDLEIVIKPLSAAFEKFAESTSYNLNLVLDNIHASLSSIFPEIRKAEEAGKISTYMLKTTSKTARSVKELDAGYLDALKKLSAYVGATKKGNATFKASGKEAATLKNMLDELGLTYKDLGDGQIEVTNLSGQIKTAWDTWTTASDNLKKSMAERIPLLGKLLGLENEEKETTEKTSKTYEDIDALAKDVILGKFGDGEARKKALEELGVSYAVIQNRVNELLGVEKRHEVTAEEEAKALDKLGITTEEGAEKTEKSMSIGEKMLVVLAGIKSAIKIVTDFASSLWNKILVPFGKWAGTQVLTVLLNLLTSIGTAVVGLSNKIPDGFFDKKFEGITNFFTNVGTSFSGFLEKVQNLEAFQKLSQAFTNLGGAVRGFFSTGFETISGIFSDIGQSAEEGINFDWALPIIENLSNVLTSMANAISTTLGAVWPILTDFGLSLKNLFETIKNSETTQKLVDAFTALHTSVSNLLSAGFEAVINFFTGLGKSSEEGGHKLDWFSGIIESISKGLTWFAEKVTWVTDTVSNFVNTHFTSENFENFKKSIKDFIDKAKESQPVQDLMLAFDSLATSIEKLFNPDKGIDDVTRSVGEAGDAAEEAEPKFNWLLKIVEGLSTILTTIVGWADSGIQKLIEFFSKKENAATLEKLSTSFKSLKEAVSGVLGLAFDNVLAFFTNIGKDGEEAKKGMDLTETVSTFERVANAVMFVVNSLTDLLNLIVANGGNLHAAFVSWFDGVDFKKLWSDFKLNLITAFGEVFLGKESEGDPTLTRGAVGIMDSVTDGIEEQSKTLPQLMAEKLTGLPGEIAAALKGLMSKVDTAKVFEGIKIGGIGVLGLGIGKFFTTFGKGIKAFAKLPKSILKTFDSLKGTLTAYQNDLNATALLKCAGAIGILVLSLWGLSKIDPKALAATLGVITPLVIAIGGLIYAIEKIKSVKKVADDTKGLTKVVTPLGQFADAVQGFLGKVALGVNVALIIGSLMLLVNSLQKIGSMEWGQLLKAGIVLVVVGGYLWAFTKVMQNVAKTMDVGTAASLFFLAAAVTALSGAIYLLGGMDLPRLVQGGIAAAAMMIVMAGAARIAGDSAQHMAKFGAGAILLALGLTMLLVPLTAFSWIMADGDRMIFFAKGLGVMAGILVGFALVAKFAAPQMIKLGLAMYSISKSMINMALSVVIFAAGIALVGAAINIFVRAIVDAGEIIISNFGAFLAGLAMVAGAIVGFVAVVTALAPIMKLAAPAIKEFGLGLLMIAGAVFLFVSAIALLSVTSPVIKDFFAGIGTYVKGATDGLQSFAESLPLIGEVVKKIFGESKDAIKGFGSALDEMGIRGELKEDLMSRFTELTRLSGKDFSLAIDDLIAYVNGLELPEEEKTRILKEYINGLEIDAKKNYGIALKNLKATISNEIDFDTLGKAGLYLQIQKLLDLSDKKGFFAQLSDVKLFLQTAALSDAAKNKIATELTKLDDEDLTPEQRRVILNGVMLYINTLSYQGEAQQAVQDAFDAVAEAENPEALEIAVKNAQAVIDGLMLSDESKKNLSTNLSHAANTLTPEQRKVFLDNAYLNILKLDWDEEGKQAFIDRIANLTGLDEEAFKEGFAKIREELEAAGYSAEVIAQIMTAAENLQKEYQDLFKIRLENINLMIGDILLTYDGSDEEKEKIKKELEGRYEEIKNALLTGDTGRAIELATQLSIDLQEDEDYNKISPENRKVLADQAYGLITAANEALAEEVDKEARKGGKDTSYVIGNNLFGLKAGSAVELPIRIKMEADGELSEEELNSVIENIADQYSSLTANDIMNSLEPMGLTKEQLMAILFPQTLEGVDISTLLAKDMNIEGLKQLFMGTTEDASAGLVEGFEEHSGEVSDAAGSVAEGAIAKIRDVNDSHSPSLVYKELGHDAIEGYALGIEEGQGLVDHAVNQVFGGAVSKFIPIHELLYLNLGRNAIQSYISGLSQSESPIGSVLASLLGGDIEQIGAQAQSLSQTITTIAQLGETISNMSTDPAQASAAINGFVTELVQYNPQIQQTVDNLGGINAVLTEISNDPTKLGSLFSGVTTELAKENPELQKAIETVTSLTTSIEAMNGEATDLNAIGGILKEVVGLDDTTTENLQTAIDLMGELSKSMGFSLDEDFLANSLTKAFESVSAEDIPKLVSDTAKALDDLEASISKFEDVDLDKTFGPAVNDIAAFGWILKPVATTIFELLLGASIALSSVSKAITIFSKAEVIDGFIANIPKLKAAVLGLADMLVEVAPDITKSAVDIVTVVLDTLSDPYGDLLTHITDAALRFALQFINGVSLALVNNADGLLTSIKVLTLTVLDLVLVTIRDMFSDIPMIGDAIQKGIDNVHENIQKALDGEAERLENPFEDYLNMVADSITSGFANISEVAEAAAEGKGFTVGSALEKAFTFSQGDFKGAMMHLQELLSSGELSKEEILSGILPPEGISMDDLAEYLFKDDNTINSKGFRDLLADYGVLVVEGLEEGMTENSSFLETGIAKMKEAMAGGFSGKSSKIDIAEELVEVNADTAESKGEDLAKNVGTGYEEGMTTAGETMNQATAKALFDAYLSGADAIEVNSPSKLYERLGGYSAEGYGIGIKNKTPLAEAYVRSMAVKCCLAVLKKLSDFKNAGVKAGISLKNGLASVQSQITAVGRVLGNAFKNGIESKASSAKTAGGKLGTNAKDGITDKLGTGTGEDTKGYKLGKDFGRGFEKGIRSKIKDVYNAGYDMGKAAGNGGADGEQSKSPSKVAIRLGNYFGEGFVIGINEFGSKVYTAAHDMATDAIDALSNPLSVVQDILSGDLDVDPTIRPVMDLSEIQNGVNTINAMTPAMSVGIGSISASMNRRKVDSNEEVINAINALREGMNQPSNVYNVNGITYDDGSNISDAVRGLIRAARVERRR